MLALHALAEALEFVNLMEERVAALIRTAHDGNSERIARLDQPRVELACGRSGLGIEWSPIGGNAKESALKFDASYELAPTSSDHVRWRGSTPRLEVSSSCIRIQVAKLTQLKHTDDERAIACFNFVQSLPFRLNVLAADLDATRVLHDGHGDATSKATLMVALLRAARIPARIRVLGVAPAYLTGLCPVARALMVHPITEVLLNGRWVGVDAYTIDHRLSLAARCRLLREGRLRGYSIHMRGAFTWDGNRSAFGQWSLDDPDSAPVVGFGAYHDMAQFQEAFPKAAVHGLRRLANMLLANYRIHTLRSEVRGGGSH